MILVDDVDIDGCVYLIPPNQLDWRFTLTKDTQSDDVWHVVGVRDYEFNEEVRMTYVKHNDTWQRKE